MGIVNRNRWDREKTQVGYESATRGHGCEVCPTENSAVTSRKSLAFEDGPLRAAVGNGLLTSGGRLSRDRESLGRLSTRSDRPDRTPDRDGFGTDTITRLCECGKLCKERRETKKAERVTLGWIALTPLWTGLQEETKSSPGWIRTSDQPIITSPFDLLGWPNRGSAGSVSPLNRRGRIALSYAVISGGLRPPPRGL